MSNTTPAIGGIGVPPGSDIVRAADENGRVGAPLPESAESGQLLRWDAPGTIHRSGHSPLRVLLYGNGAARNRETGHHEAGFAGSLADVLASRSGRGVDLDVEPWHDPADPAALDAFRRRRPWRYDVVVLCLAFEECARYRTAAEWARCCAELLKEFSGGTAPRTRVTIVAMPAGSARRLDRVIAARARRMRASTRVLARRADGVSYRVLPSIRLDRRREWGEFAADGAWVDFTTASHRRVSARRLRGLADEETLRQVAVDELPLATVKEEETLEQILEAVRSRYAAPVALINVIDGDRAWSLAAAGHEKLDGPRSIAFCDRTIQHIGPEVIPDTHLDASLDDNPLVKGDGGVRFYAGFPIESPQGYRVGAVCLLDTSARTVTPGEYDDLRDFAYAVERRIWSTARERALSVDAVDVRQSDAMDADWWSAFPIGERPSGA